MKLSILVACLVVVGSGTADAASSAEGVKKAGALDTAKALVDTTLRDMLENCESSHMHETASCRIYCILTIMHTCIYVALSFSSFFNSP